MLVNKSNVGVETSRVVRLQARSIRRHKELILNWFCAKGALSSGIVEGLNTKAKLTSRKAYGYRSPKVHKIALYHTLGALPTPNWTHKFRWRGKTLHKQNIHGLFITLAIALDLAFALNMILILIPYNFWKKTRSGSRSTQRVGQRQERRRR